MHSSVQVILSALIYFVSLGSCGVLFSHVTKYETESVELPCFTSLNEQVEWKVISPLQNYILGYERRIYSTNGMQRGFERTGRYNVIAGSGFYNLTIRNLNISESGEYVCVEDLEAGDRSSTHLFVNVNVSLLEKPISLQVIKGDDVTLPCRRNIGGPIRWLCIKSNISPQFVIFNGVSIESKYVGRITAQVNEHSGDFNLLFHNVGLNDSGLYLCVEDWGVLYKHAIQLNVLVNISDIKPERELTIQSGTSVILPFKVSLDKSVRLCYAKSRNTPQKVIFDTNAVDLKFVGRSPPDSVLVHHSSQEYNLSLHNVQINESGWYICFEDESFHSYLLNVHVDTSTLQSYQQLSIDEGSSITLPCYAHLGGAVRWYYSNSQKTIVIFNEDSTYSNYTDSFTTRVNRGFQEYNLTFEKVKINQYGWYICVDDSNSHPYLLDVFVNISLLKTFGNSSIAIGEKVSLSCQSNHSGPVRWMFFNGTVQRVIFSGTSVASDYIGRAFVDQTNGVFELSLHNVQLTDLGCYICVVDGDVHPINLTQTAPVNAQSTLSSSDVRLLMIAISIAVCVVCVVTLVIFVGCFIQLRKRRLLLHNELVELIRLVAVETADLLPIVVLDAALDQWCRGVTRVNDEIFVLYKKTIVVFQAQQPFEQQQEITLEYEKEAWHLVGDHVNNQLLVSQHDSGDILRVDLKSRDVSLFIHHELGDVNGLSLTSDRLLVTSRDSLSVYNVNERSKLRVVQLPHMVKEALHAVETSRNTFILSYRAVRFNLMEISETGEIIRKFDHEEELYDPHHLALDSMDNVLFTDWDGDRVVLLNSDLQFDKVLLNKTRLRSQPCRLYYDVINKQLFVGLSTGQVNIYRWK